jgi:tRNA pseudouridine55 synthase
MPPTAAIPFPEQRRGGDAAAASGFLVLDKPAGLTSHDCVSRVRRAYGLRRVGHGGTLDPAVTGVLPIALGPATRLLPYLPGGKSYCGWIQLGLRTSSDDLQGDVLGRWPLPRLDRQQLEKALDGFRGAILQRPPSLSALHVQGERAHVRVRRGEQLDLPPRPVTIERLELLDWQPQTGLLQIGLDCSAGTYVRALARDLGDRLDCGGALAQLRRTAALGFQLDQALAQEQLPQRPPLLEPLAALAHLPRHRLSPEAWESWRCGRRLPDSGGLALDQAVAVIDPLGALAGIGRSDGQGWIQPRLVFGAAG